MRRIFKAFVLLAAAGALVFVGAGVALATTVATSGLMTVQVHEHQADGVHLYIPVPAALVNVALAALPLAVPQDELADMRREMEPFAPALKAIAAEIRDCPDVVMVRVEDGSDRVRVEKNGRSLIVTVEAEDADIRVSLPASSFSQALDALL